MFKKKIFQSHCNNQFKIKLSCIIVLFTNKYFYFLNYYYIIINLFSLKFANVFEKYRNVYCG